MGDPRPWPPPSRFGAWWHRARDIDAVVAQRLGLTGPEETMRRTWAWGLTVLGVLLVAVVVSPAVAGSQSDRHQVAPAAAAPRTPIAARTAAPEARADDYRTTEDQVLRIDAAGGVLAKDSYGDESTLRLRAESVDAPAGAAAALAGAVDLARDGSFTYTPPLEFAGVDSFFYVAADGDDPSVRSAPARVDVTVAAVNDAAVAVPDRFSTPQDTVLRVDPPGVLTNDTDVDSGAASLRAATASSPNHGTVDLGPDGGFTYRPNPGFGGLDAFTYTVTDGIAAPSAPAQVTIEVTEANVAPATNDDGYSTGVDEALAVPAPGVLANDVDANDDAVAARVDVAPGAGTLTLADDGGFTYTPPPGFSGLERFTYVASDGVTDSKPANVTIVVGPAAEAFDLGEDAFGVDENSTLAVAAPGVLANDGLAGTARRAELVRGPASGIVELLGDGSFIYVPDDDFFGEDSLEYVVTLGDAVSPPTTVVLAVEAVEDPPGPTPPTIVAPVAAPPPRASTVVPAPPAIPGGEPPADADPDGDGGAGADGAGADAPAPTAGGGDAAPAPTGEEETSGADPMTGVTIDVAGPVAQELGDTPVVSLKEPRPEGQVTVNSDGTVTYVPAPELLGRDAFGYRACNLDERCATGTIELMIRAGPDAESPPEVTFNNVRDDEGVPWLALALATAVLLFAVVMAVVVVRALRGPADPFAESEPPPVTPPPAPA